MRIGLALGLVGAAMAAGNAVDEFKSLLVGRAATAADLFTRPTEGVLVIVDAAITPEEMRLYPALAHASAAEVGVVAALDTLALHNVAAQFPQSSVATVSAYGSLSDQIVARDGTHMTVYKYENDKLSAFVEMAVKPAGVQHVVVIVSDGDARLDAELAMLKNHLVDSESLRKQNPPRVVVGFVGGLPTASTSGRAAALAKLSKELEALRASLTSARPVFLVAFTGHSSLTTTRRTLTRVLDATPTPKFMGSDYVIMVWSLVILGFIVFFIFCCIPWAPTLDPILRTLMKSAQADGKLA